MSLGSYMMPERKSVFGQLSKGVHVYKAAHMHRRKAAADLP